MRSSKQRGFPPTVALALLLAGIASAQHRGARDVARWLERNREQLRRYAWTVRTEVEIDGESAIVRLERLSPGPDGRRTRTEIETTSSLRRKKRARIERRERALRELIDAYTQMSPGAMRDAFARAFVDDAPEGSEGGVRVQIRDVVHAGDSMSLWLDARARPARVEVFTALDGEPVRMLGEYAHLDQGPGYLARSAIETERGERKLVVREERFDVVPAEG